MSIIYLVDFSVEILHLIFDRIDIIIILRSIRYVCKQLYGVTNSYNRYKIDISLISMSNIKFIFHQIHPENINSLILNDDYYNRFDITRFTRLHSLALFNIKNNHLTNYFQHICSFQVH